jgi:hypothetical protein
MEGPIVVWAVVAMIVRCTTLYGKVCRWIATGGWFSPGTPVSSTNKTDQNIVESGVKQPQTNKQTYCSSFSLIMILTIYVICNIFLDSALKLYIDVTLSSQTTDITAIDLVRLNQTKRPILDQF